MRGMVTIHGREWFEGLSPDKLCEAARAMSPMHPEQWKVIAELLAEQGVTFEQMREEGKL